MPRAVKRCQFDQLATHERRWGLGLLSLSNGGLNRIPSLPKGEEWVGGPGVVSLPQLLLLVWLACAAQEQTASLHFSWCTTRQLVHPSQRGD